MSDSGRPHRWQPTRLPHPWDSPGKNAGVGCHFLFQCMKVKSESEVAQSCPTQRPHGLQPTRLLCPWDFPSKSTGVGCHCLLQEKVLTAPKELYIPTCQCRIRRRLRFSPWFGKKSCESSFWENNMAFFFKKKLFSNALLCHEESDTTERLPFHFSLSCTGEGNGNPLQRSCLENPRDRGAWWAAVYGVTQSRT